jgi:hypothetical protein
MKVYYIKELCFGMNEEDIVYIDKRKANKRMKEIEKTAQPKFDNSLMYVIKILEVIK